MEGVLSKLLELAGGGSVTVMSKYHKMGAIKYSYLCQEMTIVIFEFICILKNLSKNYQQKVNLINNNFEQKVPHYTIMKQHLWYKTDIQPGVQNSEMETRCNNEACSSSCPIYFVIFSFKCFAALQNYLINIYL